MLLKFLAKYTEHTNASRQSKMSHIQARKLPSGNVKVTEEDVALIIIKIIRIY